MNIRIGFSLVALIVAGLPLLPAGAQEAQHDHQHPPAPASAAAQADQASAAKTAEPPTATSGGEGMMDTKAMCDMHRKMMATKSSKQRQAMADKQMKGMSAEQRQQHMKMMDEMCK
jgi:hypothetical protein